MTHEDVAGWLTAALAMIGAGVCIAAGAFVAAGLIKAAVVLLRSVASEAIAWRDLREAVDEWKTKHPDKAARYDGEGPWRTW